MKNIFIVCCLSLLVFTAADASLLNPDKTTELTNKAGIAATADGQGYATLGGQSFNNILIIIVQALLSILGMIFLILTFIAGNSWMQAAGSEEKVQKAKDTIRNLLIGLGLILIAYALSAGFGGLLTGTILK